MDKFHLLQFQALLRREILEHRNLFIGAPAMLAFLCIVFAIWAMSIMSEDQLATAIASLAMVFNGLSPADMAPLFMVFAAPFIGMLFICSFIYLINTLYQDRRDLSVLFWQSMPVSDLKTVLSKVVMVVAIAPIFYMAFISAIYFIAIVWLSILGFSYDIELAGLGYMFMAAFVSLFLVYLSAVLSALWLLPFIGWFMLFSAFAKRTPFLWGIGVFFLVGLLEGLIFRTQYMANWVDSRSNPNQYVIFDFASVFDRLFNYDMLFGIFVGSILLAGAVLMRRFND